MCDRAILRLHAVVVAVIAGAILVIARIRSMAIIRASTGFAPTLDHDNAVYVIGHDDKGIQF